MKIIRDNERQNIMIKWSILHFYKWRILTFLEENIGEILDLVVSFQLQRQKHIPWIKNKLDFIKIKLFKIKLSVRIKFFKIKNFCPEKDTVKRMKRQVIPWEKIIV